MFVIRTSARAAATSVAPVSLAISPTEIGEASGTNESPLMRGHQSRPGRANASTFRLASLRLRWVGLVAWLA